MIPKLSPLSLDTYYITDLVISTVPCKSEQKAEVITELKTRDFTINLNIVNQEEDAKFLIEVDINNLQGAGFDNQPAGYSFGIKLVGVFLVNSKDQDTPIDKKSEEELILYSAVPMLINIGRGHLSAFTSTGFFGPYTLPILDFNSLILEWITANKKTVKGPKKPNKE